MARLKLWPCNVWPSKRHDEYHHLSYALEKGFQRKMNQRNAPKHHTLHFPLFQIKLYLSLHTWKHQHGLSPERQKCLLGNLQFQLQLRSLHEKAWTIDASWSFSSYTPPTNQPRPCSPNIPMRHHRRWPKHQQKRPVSPECRSHGKSSGFPIGNHEKISPFIWSHQFETPPEMQAEAPHWWVDFSLSSAANNTPVRWKMFSETVLPSQIFQCKHSNTCTHKQLQTYKRTKKY